MCAAATKKEKMRMSTAEVNGASIRYETQGDGDPLVLVHAGIADGRMWEPQMETFTRQYRVIRHDMRGFGETDLVEGPYSHHEDLRGLLDHLGVERAAFVGCSMGGGAVLDFALSYPERVAALVLVGSAIGGFDPGVEPPEEWDELVAADEAGDLEQVSELEVRMWVDGPGQGMDRVEPEIRDLVREMNLIALQNEASELGEELDLEPPAADRLPEIQSPTLVIIGDLDQPRTIQGADLLARSIPSALKVTMSGVAHLPNMERPEEFDRIVLDFLAERR